MNEETPSGAERSEGRPAPAEARGEPGGGMSSHGRATATELPTLQRLVAMFRGALASLGKAPTDPELEGWAVLVHASMSGRGRSYHTVEHVFDVNDAGSGAPDAIGTLAILFHDAVYCEVDGGLPRGLARHLGDALRVEDGRAELGPFDPDEDPQRALVAHLFGFTPGQAVSFQAGLNELASALLAVRALSSHLSARELAEVVACVEATISFRPAEAEEELAARLARADATYALGLGADGVEQAVRRAVRVANRDVGNFAYEDPGAFLSHTWEILPEANPTLRAPAYTLGEYREALTKMAGFLATLTPERVFRSYGGEPSAAELERLHERGRTNLARGRRYLRQKLLSARVLETLAQLTGGDGPVSLFMGDLPSERLSLRLEQLLPPAEVEAPDVDRELLRLLVEGRQREVGFDLRHSPLAAHMYARMGEARSEAALERDDGWPLLEALPAGMVAELARACALVAPTRAAPLSELARRLS